MICRTKTALLSDNLSNENRRKKDNYFKICQSITDIKTNKIKTSEENKKYTIPSGIDKLNYLLSIIEKGGNIDEAYLSLTSSA